MTVVEIPTPTELDHAPELATLAALEATLLAARFALIAAHPPLRDAECRAGQDAPDSYWIASVFPTMADQLGDVIGGYRRAMARERGGSREDDLPCGTRLFLASALALRNTASERSTVVLICMSIKYVVSLCK